MKPVTVVVERRAQASAEAAFAAVMPIDLATIFTGSGPLPAVLGVRDQTGPWDAAGRTRVVLLAGGGTMAERLTEVMAPHLFAYEVRPLDGVLRRAVDHIDGQFVFAADPAGGTSIVWSYAFHPRSALMRPAVLALAPLWRRYATQVVAACARAAEAAEHPVD